MSSADLEPPAAIAGGLADSHGRSPRGEVIVRIGVATLSLYHLALAASMTLAPVAFFEDIGPFGTRNDHYLRDLATYNFAFAAALAVAYRRPSWRAPMLCCVAVQFVLHAINHLADIDGAHPHWLGPADFVSLAISAVAVTLLAFEALRNTKEAPQ